MTIAAAQELQRRASDPRHHVWVSASAGSGKTTVLITRILRLLLSGVEPQRILCLTYTKAAAMEMRLRLARVLSEWATVEANQLYEKLTDRLGTEPTDDMLKNARRLFAVISDAPDALRIQTIHSFCQSILARFPIEAGIAPGFTALDEYQAAPLMRRALEQAWTDQNGNAWQRAKTWCEKRFGMTQLLEILPGLMREFPEMQARMQIIGEDIYWQETFVQLNAPEDEAAVWAGEFSDQKLPMAALRDWQEAIGSDELAQFLAADNAARDNMREAYLNLFLTREYEPRAKLMKNKGIAAQVSDAHQSQLQYEQERMLLLHQAAKTQRLAIASAAMGIVVARTESAYSNIKAERSALDFNDLVQKTHALLASPKMGEWVHYKLDGGIDHVLVDEAQDTAPLQWEVIHHLVAEFFAGSGRSERERSLFVVGDPKQSIYSFQGADARAFQHLRTVFAARAAEAEAKFQDVPLSHSFRTSKNLLSIVDRVFEQNEMRGALQNTTDEILHHSIHNERIGQIKIYPPIPAPPRASNKGMNDEADENEKQNVTLAREIAGTVKAWLTGARAVAGTDQAVQPKDILVLMQQRTTLADAVLTALRNENIPVLGNDRLKLLEATAVADLICFCRFLLLPDDHLNLAQLLRSPLIDLAENELAIIAAKRDKTTGLWQALQQSPQSKITDYLKSWLARADIDGAYQILSDILALPCPAGNNGLAAFHARLGHECDDPINELLQIALSEGQKDAPLGLQNFVHQLAKSEIEIKREMAQQTENAVRILTVHGAKGLEAPIVILADASELPHESGNKKPRAIPYDKNIPHFLFAPDKSAQGPDFDRSEIMQMRENEYFRLLYVALTRAKHEIHIFGKGNKDGEAKDKGWYAEITRALRDAGATEIADNHFHYGAMDQTGEISPATEIQQITNPWLMKSLPPAPAAKTIAVTEYLQQKYPWAEVEYGGATFAREKGNIIHRLLELLPNIPAEQQAAAAERYITRQLPELKPEDGQSWAAQCMRILHDVEFAPFFAKTAQAEASISGIWQNAPMTGKIDRFYVDDDTIHILDFKTTAHPPTDGIPPAYREQLQIYGAFLTELFPNRRVRAGILWTENLIVDWLSENDLEFKVQVENSRGAA